MQGYYRPVVQLTVVTKINVQLEFTLISCLFLSTVTVIFLLFPLCSYNAIAASTPGDSYQPEKPASYSRSRGVHATDNPKPIP